MKWIIAVLALAACNKSLSWSPGSTTPSSNSSNPTSSSGGSSPTAPTPNAPYAASATSGPDAWKHYDIRGVQLGMARTQLAKMGFTCEKRANSRCYKQMDPRCDGHKCDVHSDAFGQWWEVDGLKTTLDYMSIATTETDAALAYDIHLAFGPRQPLDRDSTLGKALIAKYGDATSVEEGAKDDKVGGGRMLWWNNDIGSNGPNVIVECNGTNSVGPQCSLSAGDNGILTAERSRQETIDAKRKKDNQPKAAPAL